MRVTSPTANRLSRTSTAARLESRSALDALRRRGHADVTIDLAGAALRALELFQPDDPPTSLFFGEAGLLTVAYRLAPSDDLADRLFARVTENARNEANELMWGAPGSMLVAHAMHEWTGDERWRDAWTESADVVTKPARRARPLDAAPSARRRRSA